jgi:hypothetical protein
MPIAIMTAILTIIKNFIEMNLEIIKIIPAQAKATKLAKLSEILSIYNMHEYNIADKKYCCRFIKIPINIHEVIDIRAHPLSREYKAKSNLEFG